MPRPNNFSDILRFYKFHHWLRCCAFGIVEEFHQTLIVSWEPGSAFRGASSLVIVRIFVTFGVVVINVIVISFSDKRY